MLCRPLGHSVLISEASVVSPIGDLLVALPGCYAFS